MGVSILRVNDRKISRDIGFPPGYMEYSATGRRRATSAQEPAAGEFDRQ